MTEEERNKEIEWLMGSIKESYAEKKDSFVIGITSVAFADIVQYIMSHRDIASILWEVLIGVFILVLILLSWLGTKKISRAATPGELLAIHDRIRIYDLSLLLVFFVVGLFIPTMSTFIKCLILLLLLLRVFSRWIPVMQDYWKLNDIKQLRELVNGGTE